MATYKIKDVLIHIFTMVTHLSHYNRYLQLHCQTLGNKCVSQVLGDDYIDGSMSKNLQVGRITPNCNFSGLSGRALINFIESSDARQTAAMSKIYTSGNM